MLKHGHARNKKPSREYIAWGSMIRRCAESSNVRHMYFDRGITVCDRWRDFDNFLHDMGTRPSPDYSLDRINNDGNYEPGNVRWATRSEQARNRRSNHIIEIDGEFKSLAEWTEVFGTNRNMAFQRILRGWTERDAVSLPPKR